MSATGCATYAVHEAALVPHATPLPTDGQPLAAQGELGVGASKTCSTSCIRPRAPRTSATTIPATQLRGALDARVAGIRVDRRGGRARHRQPAGHVDPAAATERRADRLRRSRGGLDPDRAARPAHRRRRRGRDVERADDRVHQLRDELRRRRAGRVRRPVDRAGGDGRARDRPELPDRQAHRVRRRDDPQPADRRREVREHGPERPGRARTLQRHLLARRRRVRLPGPCGSA